MDTLAKETMGLPIFICATNQQIISSGTSGTSTHPSHTSITATTASSTTSSTNPSPTTPFFATATPTRSHMTSTFFPPLTAFSSSNNTSATTNTTAQTQTHQRRNTYTPPTFSAPTTRRESLLSTHRLSQVFDFASTYAVEVLSKAADSVFGAESGRQGVVVEGIWGAEDLEAGDGQREGEGKRGEKGRYQRFGEEGGFEGWLD